MYRVALFARAWIETKNVGMKSKIPVVALFARAWIETLRAISESHSRESPSSRGRGLKLKEPEVSIQATMSPSSRGRGLKHARTIGQFDRYGRRPLREGVD